DSLLEIGCGSGTEAIALAHMGASVLATDASPGMIEVLRGKLALPSLRRLEIEPRVLRAEQLGLLRSECGPGAFDGAYSSLGPLNCVDDLSEVVANLAYLVDTGGVVAVS